MKDWLESLFVGTLMVVILVIILAFLTAGAIAETPDQFKHRLPTAEEILQGEQLAIVRAQMELFTRAKSLGMFEASYHIPCAERVVTEDEAGRVRVSIDWTKCEGELK